MKRYLLTTALAVLAAPAFACETLPIANSNAVYRADPTCPLPTMQGGKSMPLAFVLAALADDDEGPADPVDPVDPVDPPDEEEPTDPPEDDEPVDEPPADEPEAEGDH
jgi:hypothetical protein